MLATLPVDLRTGQTPWVTASATEVPLATPSDQQVEVLIVGAGISGALCADALSAAGMDVLVIDRRGVARGSTAASTALLLYELDTPLTNLSKAIGTEAATRIWQRSRLGVTTLMERTKHLGIDAGLRECSSLYLQGTLLDSEALREEGKARQRIGLPTEYIEKHDVAKEFGLEDTCALRSLGNGVVDPCALTAGYLRAAINRGARAIAPLNVSRVDTHAPGVVVTTEEAISIRARYLIYATGYELPKGVPTQGHRLISTWVIATKPLSHLTWEWKHVLWEASDPYLYMRTTNDGRIICGGLDDPFLDEDKRDSMLERKARTLSNKLGQLLPWIDPTPDLAWTGTFGDSSTGAPTIGKVPGMQNTFAVLGYGGNGITFSMIAAQLFCAEITGKRDYDAEFFHFSKPIGDA